MAMTVTDQVRQVVAKTPVGGFVRSAELARLTGARGAADTALHRIAAAEDLLPVRPGLYWKAKRTRFGLTRPDPLTVAYEIAKGRGFDSGVGPAGITAARHLGLTTQVPAVEEVAVPGRAPASVPGVIYRSRTAAGRRGLTPLEVAVLELLREWPRYSEQSWPQFVSAVARLAEQGKVDVDRVRVAASREHHAAARDRATQLANSIHHGHR